MEKEKMEGEELKTLHGGDCRFLLGFDSKVVSKVLSKEIIS